MSQRLEVVFEDADILVANKPPGMLTERDTSSGISLADWVEDHCGKPARPVHRLDRDTSGLVIFARNAKWNRAFAELFEKKRLRKEYWAIVNGRWDRSVTKVDARIEVVSPGRYRCGESKGKPAVTTFRALASDGEYTWVQALPKTGRTHQIRLHCLHAGHPIVGDRFYASDGDERPLMLHARSLGFQHPNGSGNLSLIADPPHYWRRWMDALETSMQA